MKVSRTPNLGDVVQYLRENGVEAEVVEAPAPSVWTTNFPAKEMVRLTGKHFNEIRLIEEFIGYGGRKPYFHYEVLLDRPLAKEAKKSVVAKGIVIRQNKTLGVFGGKITGIRWYGGRIAQFLNLDRELQKMILDCKLTDRSEDIEIKPEGKSAVDIIIHACSPASLEIDIYDRIAKHVREVVRAY